MSEETEVTITSNGSILTPRIINKLIDSGLDRIKISIQGITQETYEERASCLISVNGEMAPIV